MKYPESIIINSLLMLIKLYQQAISPWLGVNCRYMPSCSKYTATALKSYGFFYGVWLGFKRIVRCHPWGKEGYDPVPKKKLQ